MRFAAILLAACGLVPAMMPQETAAPASSQDPQWVQEVRDKPLVYSVPGMAEVKVQKDVIYKQAGNIQLKADIYQASGARKGEKRPVVIFIHGGYLPPNLLTPPKEWTEYQTFGRLAAASGFVGVTFNHRFFSGFQSLPDAQADLNELIEFVRSHAETFGTDKDRLTLWAFSGGGYLLSQFLRESPPYIRGLIAYYTIMDFTPAELAAPERLPAEIAKKFSAVEALAGRGSAVPPLFVARAGLDHPVRNATIDHFIRLAIAGNADIEVMNHPSGHHGFDVEDDNERSREIIRSTLEFIRARN